MANLTCRIIENSKDESGRTVLLRRLYCKGRRVKDTFTLERGERDGEKLKAHYITLFGKKLELATFMFDRHENVYVDADTGAIYDTLNKAIEAVLRLNGYLPEVTP